MKGIAFSIFILNASSAIAGGGMGGGTPPAREVLEQILMENQSISGGLFDLGNGKIGLGLKGSLEPELRIFKSGVQTQALKLSELDFDLVRSNGTVDAVNLANLELNRSYAVEDGDSLGELLLRDRRQRSRESVK